ncbi:MAG: hypothetical protein F8N37_07805 [Telmatospirillum sp.]|nr:hypothetical protein [Telmatospirillum sp.]
MFRSLPSRARSSRALLDIILDDPDVALSIRDLPAATLADCVETIGLEDSGLLLALATDEQILGVLDQILWTEPGGGGSGDFDPAAFMVWLEISLDAGEVFLAETLAALPGDLVVFTFHQCVAVLEFDRLQDEIRADDDSDMALKALESAGFQEIEEFVLVPRRAEGVDAVMQALLALDQHDHGFLRQILESCARLTAADLDDGTDLTALLNDARTLAMDVAGAREDRRDAAGFVAPSKAAAYLKFARDADLRASDPLAAEALTALYFRRPPRSVTMTPRYRAGMAGARDGLTRLLARAGGIGDRRGTGPASVIGEGEKPPAAGPARRALRSLAGTVPGAYERCVDDLIDLCNILVSGATWRGGVFPRPEAILAVSALFELGMETFIDRFGGGAAHHLCDRGAEPFVRLGLARLHHDVGLRPLDRLCACAAGALARSPAPGRRDGLLTFIRAAAAARQAGQPWRVRNDLFLLGDMLEGPVLALAENLLDQIPALPAPAPPGDIPRRGSAPWRFFASRADIERIEAILDRALSP